MLTEFYSTDKQKMMHALRLNETDFLREEIVENSLRVRFIKKYLKIKV